MAFNETFWVVIATSALVIALASVVASGDSYKMREFFGSLKSHPNSHVRKIEARNTREINTVLIWAIINNLAQAYAFMTAVLNISTRSELPFDQISSLICEIGGLLAIIPINSYVSRMQYIFKRT
jgi:hypothetical protein